MGLTVFWRYATDSSTTKRIESFPSKAAANRWIVAMKKASKKHPEEAAFVLITTVD